MKFGFSVLLICSLADVLAGSSRPVSAAGQEGGGAPMPGRSIYDQTCSRCHGPDGQDGKAPTLTPFRWTYKQALDIVRHGGACGMPAFSESDLSDEAVQQIVDYLKTLN
jgi:mono/diheme cytochrome c family protein